MKENIYAFIEKRTVIDTAVIETNAMLEEKYIRRRASIDRWKNIIESESMIEFDDSAKSFLSIKENTNVIDTLMNLRVKIKDGNGNEIDIESMPFHFALEIEKAVIDFFIHA